MHIIKFISVRNVHMQLCWFRFPLLLVYRL